MKHSKGGERQGETRVPHKAHWHNRAQTGLCSSAQIQSWRDPTQKLTSVPLSSARSTSDIAA